MTFSPGDILLGKYRIERLIGAGAFAEVYQATHVRLNKVYALKVLRRDGPGLGSSEYGRWVERFRQEAMLGAKLKNSYVVKVEDYEEEGDLLVLRMDYLPGGSLADRLQRYREQERLMPVDEAVRIAMEVAQGLAALHALDAVHRDVKPSNVLFTADGRAQLADLGLAQIPGGASMRSVLSEAAAHPGTPAYMSPEQARSVEHLTPASDVYALGAVLFEMLAGRLYKNVRPGISVQALRADTPDWVAKLLGSMLARDPEARPWDGGEAAEALRTAGEEARRREEAKRQEDEASAARKAEAERQRAEEDRRRQEAEAARLLAEEKTRQQAREVERQKEAEAAPPRAEEAAKRRAKEANKQMPVWQQIGIELVTIPAGEFLMGSDPGRDSQAYAIEKPHHKLKLGAYQLAKTPVTNRQYKAFVDATEHAAPAHWQRGKIPAGKEEHPVVYVSWRDAVAFCAWVGMRLPSEAEWEKGARGTDGRSYPWGNEAPDDKRCNFAMNVRYTTAVGKYPAGASPFGLLDMAGNVWEWTSSLSKDYPYRADDAREDQTAGGSRVLRGGSWYDESQLVRSAFRLRNQPDDRNGFNGFRCARSL